MTQHACFSINEHEISHFDNLQYVYSDFVKENRRSIRESQHNNKGKMEFSPDMVSSHSFLFLYLLTI